MLTKYHIFEFLYKYLYLQEIILTTVLGKGQYYNNSSEWISERVLYLTHNLFSVIEYVVCYSLLLLLLLPEKCWEKWNKNPCIIPGEWTILCSPLKPQHTSRYLCCFSTNENPKCSNRSLQWSHPGLNVKCLNVFSSCFLNLSGQ